MPSPMHGGNVKFAHKPKNTKKSLGKLLYFLKPYLFAIIIALVFAVSSTVINIIAPRKIGDMTSLVTEGLFLPTGIDFAEVGKIGILLVILYAISAVLGYVQGWIMTTATQRAEVLDTGMR